jgi:membrane associated rhomboid family serine protease
MQKSQIQIPQITFLNKVIIAILVGFFIFTSALEATAGISLAQMLGLNANSFLGGHIYQLLTYPLIGRGLMEVVFNCLLFWFIGGDLEYMWGKNRYIGFMISTVIFAGILFVPMSIAMGSSMFALTGIGGVVNAMLIAYATYYPYRTFTFMLIFPMQARWFCWILITMQVYFGLFSAGKVMAWGHLLAMGWGFMFVKFAYKWEIFEMNFFKKKATTFKRTRSKANLSIVKDDDKANDDEDKGKDDEPTVWH